MKPALLLALLLAACPGPPKAPPGAKTCGTNADCNFPFEVCSAWAAYNSPSICAPNQDPSWVDPEEAAKRSDSGTKRAANAETPAPRRAPSEPTPSSGAGPSSTEP